MSENETDASPSQPPVVQPGCAELTGFEYQGLTAGAIRALLEARDRMREKIQSGDSVAVVELELASITGPALAPLLEMLLSIDADRGLRAAAVVARALLTATLQGDLSGFASLQRSHRPARES